MAARNGVIDFLKSQWAMNRALVALLSVLMVVQPLIPSISYVMAADMVDYGQQQGRDLWNQISASQAFPDTNGGKDISVGGEKVSMAELFQAPAQDDSFRSMYGNSESEYAEKGQQGRNNLILNEKSSEGQAYRTMRESAYLSRPDLNNDPLWGSTDAVYDFLAGNPVNCTPDDNHTPDYRTCERVNLNTNACTIEHDYAIGIFEHQSGPVNMASCGEGCMDFWLGRIGENYWSGNCTIYEEKMSIKMINPDAILDARIDYAKWDDYMQIWVGDTKAWAGPNNNFPPETAGACELATNWEQRPNTDVTSLFKNRQRGEVVDLKIRVSVTGNGEGYAKVRVHFDPKKIVQESGWSNPSCLTKAKIYESKYGSNGATCDAMPTLDANKCMTVRGVTVCESAFETPPLNGISPFCQKVSVRPPPAVAAASTCTQYEKNPQCGFITSTCDGKTPTQMIEELYVVGLGQNPDPAGMNYWLSVYNDKKGDFEYVRHEFFRAAGLNGQDFNSFSCTKFVETYDCGFTHTANSGACAVQDLFKEDFADCVEELVPEGVTNTVKLESTQTCEEALRLTECRIQRDLTPSARTASNSYVRGCFITEEVAYRMPWADTATSASISIASSGQHTSADIVAQPSVHNNWTARVRLNGSGQVVTDGAGNQSTVCPAGSSLTVNLTAQGHSIQVSEREYPAEEGNSPCLRETDEFTKTSWVCEAYSPVTIDGIPLSMEALGAAIKPIYPGASPTCISAKATYTPQQFEQGQYCWTNLSGQQECTSIGAAGGGGDSCAPLKQRQATGECRYDGRFPVEDGSGSTGFQYVWEHRYTCSDGAREVTETQLVPKYTCSGIVRCMGTECMTPNREASTSFGKAAGMLQAVQAIGQDVTCDVSTGGDMMLCRVFSGEAQTCKQALGGYVNCCESPGGVSLSDYITATKGVLKADAFLTSSSVSPSISGAYSVIRQPVAAPVEYVYDAFTSAMDGVTAKMFPNAAGSLEGMGVAIDAFKQKLYDGAYTIMSEMFPSAADMLFSAGTGPAGGIGPSAALSGALAVIGMLYTIYTVTKIIINIIWKCSMDELSLAVDRDLKKTRYIGSYCHKKVLGGCIEKRKSYCIFSSPISRIINEQARPQLGRGWGSPKRPDCSGITLGELERLDWNQIDLSEWMTLLKITDNMPGMGDLSMDTITGSGSYLGNAAANQGEVRLNTGERNAERLDGVNLHQLNQDAGKDLWQQQ